jgi:hypothetical protein
MSETPELIVQVPSGGAASIQLVADPPAAVISGAVVVEHEIADEEGTIGLPDDGDIVLSVPSPEALRRDPDEVRRVLAHHATGTTPLVVIVEAASELRAEELSAVQVGARHASRPVILRVIRDG